MNNQNIALRTLIWEIIKEHIKKEHHGQFPESSFNFWQKIIIYGRDRNKWPSKGEAATAL